MLSTSACTSRRSRPSSSKAQSRTRRDLVTELAGLPVVHDRERDAAKVRVVGRGGDRPVRLAFLGPAARAHVDPGVEVLAPVRVRDPVQEEGAGLVVQRPHHVRAVGLARDAQAHEAVGQLRRALDLAQVPHRHDGRSISLRSLIVTPGRKDWVSAGLAPLPAAVAALPASVGWAVAGRSADVAGRSAVPADPCTAVGPSAASPPCFSGGSGAAR